jgi:hypothetical protein
MRKLFTAGKKLRGDIQPDFPWKNQTNPQSFLM